MKKALLIGLIMILFLTGCKSVFVQAKEELNAKIKKDCKEFQSVSSGTYGGGEGMARGYVKVGYCDNNFVAANMRLKRGIFNPDFEYKESKYLFNNHVLFSKFFPNQIYFVSDYNKSNFVFSIATTSEQLTETIDTLKEEFLPLVPNVFKQETFIITIVLLNHSSLSDDQIKAILVNTSGPNEIEDFDDEYIDLEDSYVYKNSIFAYENESNISIKNQLEAGLNRKYEELTK